MNKKNLEQTELTLEPATLLTLHVIIIFESKFSTEDRPPPVTAWVGLPVSSGYSNDCKNILQTIGETPVEYPASKNSLSNIS